MIAKTDQEDDSYSFAAVLAQICHEYTSFGKEAFFNNTLQYLILEHDSQCYMARPIFNLILCFVCDKRANLGLVRCKIDKIAQQLERELQPLKEHLQTRISEQQ